MIHASHELLRLRRWKAEATPLLQQLDRCHSLLPPDAQANLGQHKGDAVERYLTSLADSRQGA